MNTNDPWTRLSNAARRRPRQTEAPAEMPWGFDTRVLAQLRDRRSLPAELWLRLAWRMVPVGAAVFMVCWFAIRPAPAAWPTPDSAELTELLIEEVLPQ
jgi:hypothetical protein